MSQPTTPPALPPAPATVAAVEASPWWARKTTWTAVLAFMAGAPVLANQITPLLTPKQAATLTTIAALLAAVAALFARMGGVQAAAVVKEQTTGTGPNA